MSMDQKASPESLSVAEAAGLQKAIAEFPSDVAEAARAAAQEVADMPDLDGTLEPWPSMRVRRER
jgi:hypothetical protein